MQKFKFINVLLIFTLAVALLTPFSSASASDFKKQSSGKAVTTAVADTYCTDDTYGPGDDTYDPTGDTYEPVDIYYTEVTETSIFIEWDYYGDWSDNLSFNLYIDGQLMTNNADWHYVFEGLTHNTSYEVKVEAVKDGSATGEYATVVVTTWDYPSGDVVQIEDATLEETIRETLNVHDRPLQESDMQHLTSLYAVYYGYTSSEAITSLKGLEHATNLKELVLGYNRVSDLTPIANLTSLELLDLEFNLITDISSLNGLVNLQTLYLTENPVSNLEPLLSLNALEYVGLWGMVFDEDAKSVIQTLTNNGVFVGSDYEFEITGWFEKCGNWYYRDENGLYRGWLLDNGTWYYFSEKQDETLFQMVTGWNLINGKWYFFNEDGAMKTGWLKEGGKWYFLTSSGHMATGWIKDGGSWYHLSASGAMSTGWVKDGASWYYLTGSGAMKTGWLFSGSKWYHLQGSGAMSVGWKKINNKWYYFYNQGHMAANTVIDGYKVGKDGAWIQ
ncbi:leucine-rich repeat domain-containing protein [Bacillus timonensis]|nr:leucine-rich repeat domain-containing protein [Bacillus timonensis]